MNGNRKSMFAAWMATMLLCAIFDRSAFAKGDAAANNPIRAAQQRSVKIYGAGGLRGLQSYQSGFLISAQGHVLTVFSHVLDTDTLVVTLDDGRKFDGKLLGVNPRLEIAVLKIEANDLPFFDLKQAATGMEGTRVLAFSNLFGVATGDEPVSMLHGSIAAVTALAARRGAYEMPFQGQVYVLDAMTNNPGAAGGALTNMRGELLGMLGKELRNSRNNTWLNFALPAQELAPAVAAIESGQAPATAAATNKKVANPLAAGDLGVVLLPNVLERTPPFVDTVRPNTPAAKAGLHPDDLVLFVNNQLVQSCKDFNMELERLDRDEAVKLVVMRNGQLTEVTLKPGE